MAVLAAERKAIQAENPLYNIQHNYRPVADEPARTLTAADVLLTAALLIAAGFVIYELSQAAIEKYRTWKADREEFREWQRARSANESQLSRDADNPRSNVISSAAVTWPPAAPPDNRMGIAFMALYVTMHHPVEASLTDPTTVWPVRRAAS